MKITERRLRQIIRNVINEQRNIPVADVFFKGLSGMDLFHGISSCNTLSEIIQKASKEGFNESECDDDLSVTYQEFFYLCEVISDLRSLQQEGHLVGYVHDIGDALHVTDHEYELDERGEKGSNDPAAYCCAILLK